MEKRRRERQFPTVKPQSTVVEESSDLPIAETEFARKYYERYGIPYRLPPEPKPEELQLEDLLGILKPQEPTIKNTSPVIVPKPKVELKEKKPY